MDNVDPVVMLAMLNDGESSPDSWSEYNSSSEDDMEGVLFGPQDLQARNTVKNFVEEVRFHG